MQNIYEASVCPICGVAFTGENANLKAEECEKKHTKIIISIWDYELADFLSFFNTYDRSLLPKNFLRKLRNLTGRALNP